MASTMVSWGLPSCLHPRFGLRRRPLVEDGLTEWRSPSVDALHPVESWDPIGRLYRAMLLLLTLFSDVVLSHIGDRW